MTLGFESLDDEGTDYINVGGFYLDEDLFAFVPRQRENQPCLRAQGPSNQYLSRIEWHYDQIHLYSPVKEEEVNATIDYLANVNYRMDGVAQVTFPAKHLGKPYQFRFIKTAPSQ